MPIYPCRVFRLSLFLSFPSPLSSLRPSAFLLPATPRPLTVFPSHQPPAGTISPVENTPMAPSARCPSHTSKPAASQPHPPLPNRAHPRADAWSARGRKVLALAHSASLLPSCPLAHQLLFIPQEIFCRRPWLSPSGRRAHLCAPISPAYLSAS